MRYFEEWRCFIKTLKKYFVIAMGLSLMACAAFPTTHPDPAKNNVSTYKVDMRDCAASYPETSDGAYLKRRISCMELKGWK